MSHAASAYVKELRVAPNGEPVSPTEKALLTVLADDHRKEVGFAWSSMKTIAANACMTVRTARRHIAELERKGIIRRVAMRREYDGGQSSNDYVFPGLDGDNGRPAEGSPEREQWKQRVREIVRTPRSELTGGEGGKTRVNRGGKCPTPPVKNDLPPRSELTALEPLKEPSMEPEASPLPPASGGGGGKQETPQSEKAPVLEMPKPAGPLSAFEADLDRVMRECGFTERRLRKALGVVLESRRLQTGGSSGTVALEMVQAWKDYGENTRFLRTVTGPRKFFAQGMWLDDRLWNWDQQKLEMRRGAAVGCRR